MRFLLLFIVVLFIILVAQKTFLNYSLFFLQKHFNRKNKMIIEYLIRKGRSQDTAMML